MTVPIRIPVPPQTKSLTSAVRFGRKICPNSDKPRDALLRITDQTSGLFSLQLAKPCVSRNTSGMKGTAVRIFGSRSAQSPIQPGTQRSAVILESDTQEAIVISITSTPESTKNARPRLFGYRFCSLCCGGFEIVGSLVSILIPPLLCFRIFSASAFQPLLRNARRLRPLSSQPLITFHKLPCDPFPSEAFRDHGSPSFTHCGQLPRAPARRIVQRGGDALHAHRHPPTATLLLQQFPWCSLGRDHRKVVRHGFGHGDSKVL